MDREIFIGRGQWFSDVIPVFDPNTIYNKWITGIGGTTTAINEGYTIIISPNVAGIVSKEGIENVTAVYGGIGSETVARRVQEIEEQGLRPVIISTPDSFWKVDDALGPDIYHRFKCVIDEIHCFQEAASYRDSLPRFIDTFFKYFKQKAVITATLTPLSHPIFEKWQTVRLVPGYEYKQPLQVYYSTNQLFASVTEFVESLPAEDKKIVFFNTLKLSKGLERAGLDFTTWCAKDSKLDAVNYREFDGQLEGTTLATCAYFQACDIAEEAHVIFVVDAPNAPHTTLTINQILQALGRCRKGALSATLFFRPKMTGPYGQRPREELMQVVRDMAHINLGNAQAMHKDLCGQEEYPTEQQLNNILDGMKTSIFRRKLLLYRAAENRFDINWLNIDGEVEDRFAVQFYTGPNHLVEYLRQDERLSPDFKGRYVPKAEIKDSELMGDDQSNEELLGKLVELYLRLDVRAKGCVLEWIKLKEADTTNKTMKSMMVLCERAGALNLIPELLNTKGKRQLLERFETKLVGKETVVDDLELRQRVRWTFKPGRYSSREIKTRLQRIYDAHGLNKRATAAQIHEFCEAQELTFRNKFGRPVRGYEIA